MDISSLATFALTEFLLCLTPGPAVLLVVGISMRRGFALSHYATLGILATNVAYFTLSAVGVASLILASATLFTVLKFGGAADGRMAAASRSHWPVFPRRSPCRGWSCRVGCACSGRA
ncbi:LysE family transporter [Breoghania sp.]|uniref:LysE family translocator n=1 Tax=Breoghania sp. TaxID=2065378 RepID=UPI00262A4B9D|nr:LysE family transporter [Breoghania sp.]MDJ0931893.1 LysE family transporter [Breoghania sp.]